MKKCEFVLYINGNIICQRYFNVKNYNKAVTRSIDLYDCVDSVVDLIISENIFENEDVFDFEIKVDDKAIIGKRFTGNDYQQRVRYSVDVRKIIPAIIAEITETLSQEELSVEYCGINL